jgi:hypothetical protein
VLHGKKCFFICRILIRESLILRNVIETRGKGERERETEAEREGCGIK